MIPLGTKLCLRIIKIRSMVLRGYALASEGGLPAAAATAAATAAGGAAR